MGIYGIFWHKMGMYGNKKSEVFQASLSGIEYKNRVN